MRLKVLEFNHQNYNRIRLSITELYCNCYDDTVRAKQLSIA